MLKVAFLQTQLTVPHGMEAGPDWRFEILDERGFVTRAKDFDALVVRLSGTGEARVAPLRRLRAVFAGRILAVGDATEFVDALDAGADVLAPSVLGQAAVTASLRSFARAPATDLPPAPAATWRFDRSALLLRSPTGEQVSLFEQDSRLLQALMAKGVDAPVPQEQLALELWTGTTGRAAGVKAAVHRLRRRMEAAGLPSPVYAQPGRGYALAWPIALEELPPAQSGNWPTHGAALERHNVHMHDGSGTPLLFLHGFGCDQSAWVEVESPLRNHCATALMDLAGTGQSAAAAYDFERHSHVKGHAEDLIAVVRALGWPRPVVVAHSLGAMAALRAAATAPRLFGGLVLVAPSPRFVTDAGYAAALGPDDVQGILGRIDDDYLSWVVEAAPFVAGPSASPEVAERIATMFRGVHPAVAPHLARVAFLSDVRDCLEHISVPTLIIHSEDDPIVDRHTGEYLRDAIPGSRLAKVSNGGHLPHVVSPHSCAELIQSFVASL